MTASEAVDDIARLRSPMPMFVQRLYAFGAPLLISIFALSRGGLRIRVISILIVVAISSLVLWWSYLINIETIVGRSSVTRLRVLWLFRRSKVIDLSDVSGLEIPHYSDKLVAKLRDGSELVIATTYSHTGYPLPEVPLTPADARGALHTLRRIKALVEQRRASIEI